MTTNLELDRQATIALVLLAVVLFALAFSAGWSAGRNKLYHEIFMEDIELEVVPLDELPERQNGSSFRS